MHRNICSMYANVVKTFKFCNKYPQSDYVQSISIKYNINFVENIFFMLSMNLKKKSDFDEDIVSTFFPFREM